MKKRFYVVQIFFLWHSKNLIFQLLYLFLCSQLLFVRCLSLLFHNEKKSHVQSRTLWADSCWAKKKKYRINFESCWQYISSTSIFLFLFQSHRKFPWMQKIHYGPKRKEVVDEKKTKLKTEKLKCSTFFIFQNESYNHFTKTHFCDILISRMAIQSIQIFGEWSSPRISHSPVLNSSFHFSKPHTSEQSLRTELKH